VVDVVVADLADRRGVAAAHAGGAQNAHALARAALQVGEQRLGTGERAG
jgi:hypothetical protein